MSKEDMKKRIIKLNGKYYPQYKSFFLFWRSFYYEDIVLNGYFTSLERFEVSFNELDEAIDYLKNIEKEDVIEVIKYN